MTWSRRSRPSPIAELTDRGLVRLYWPVELRPAFDTLFAIDDAMGDVVAKATEPALAAIKLAWWRERMQELDSGEVPAEPRLQASASELVPRGIAGAPLAELEDGWAALLEEQPDVDRIADRGAKLFEMASNLLGANDPLIEAAGRVYAFASAAKCGFVRMAVGTEALKAISGHRFPRALRPLTGLAALAARDLGRGPDREPEATPGRAMTLLRHRLTGRIA
jgi:phytoene synthase